MCPFQLGDPTTRFAFLLNHSKTILFRPDVHYKELFEKLNWRNPPIISHKVSLQGSKKDFLFQQSLGGPISVLTIFTL